MAKSTMLLNKITELIKVPWNNQRYLTLIDGGLVYTALSSPWGRFSDYSATAK
jgi:hypothetical protein